MGHCGGIGKLNVSASAGPACGANAGIKVHTRANGRRPGTCRLRISVHTTDGRDDLDKITLQCNPVSGPACPTTSTSTTTTPTSTTTSTTALRCPPNGGTDQPNEIVLSVASQGTDLDNGWKGPSFNFPIPGNTTLQLCLAHCDATTDPECDMTINTGAGTFNGATFGPPLPVVTAHVPVCIVNEYQQTQFTGTANIQDGSVDGEIDLRSRLFLTDEEHVCPRCEGGTCDVGPNAGGVCTVDGTVAVTQSTATDKTFHLSKDCPPDTFNPAGTLTIRLPLTTGTSTLAPLPGGSAATPCVAQPGEPTGLAPQPDTCGSGATCSLGGCSGSACATMGTDPSTGDPICVDQKGGLSQYCCSNLADVPCQPTRSGTLTRTGKASPFMDGGGMGWGSGTYPKTADIVPVATFCEPASGTNSVDGLTGLPGPGALVLPVHAVVSTSQP
jgi:hypothetical protein